MGIEIKKSYFYFVPIVLLVGCSTETQGPGFDHVRQLVDDRTGQKLHFVPERNHSTDRDPSANPDPFTLDPDISGLLRGELTIDLAVRVTLMNNPRLHAVYEDLNITYADVRQAGRLRNPVISAAARFPDRPPSATNLEFGLAIDFLDVLMLPTRQRLAGGEFKAVRLRVADEVMRVIADVHEAYFQVVGAGQAVEMRKMIRDATEGSYELSKRVHDAGNLSDLQLTRERAEYERAKVDLVEARARLSEARGPLSELMGLTPRDEPKWAITSRLPDLPPQDPPIDRLMTQALEQRLDWLASVQENRTLADALGVTRDWGWVAGLEVGVDTGRDTDRQWITGPHLQLELPIFDQGQSRTARLEAQLRQSDLRLKAMRIEILQEISVLHGRLTSTRRVIDHYRRDLIPTHERIVTLTQQQYNFMLTGVFDVLYAKQREYEAYEQYIEKVRDYWVTRSQLEAAIGGRLPKPDATVPHTTTQPSTTQPPTSQPSTTQLSDDPGTPAPPHQQHHHHHTDHHETNHGN